MDYTTIYNSYFQARSRLQYLMDVSRDNQLFPSAIQVRVSESKRRCW